MKDAIPCTVRCVHPLGDSSSEAQFLSPIKPALLYDPITKNSPLISFIKY